MKLVYGISRWTNPSRASARHIDDGHGRPLCGGQGRKVFSWGTEDGEPTCKRCIDLDAYFARLYDGLVAEARRLGYTVKLVPEKVIHDYAGMNPAAAEVLGKRQPKTEIEIEMGVSSKKKVLDLNHELYELDKMVNRGWPYWKAHEYALANEGNLVGRGLTSITESFRGGKGGPHDHKTGRNQRRHAGVRSPAGPGLQGLR